MYLKLIILLLINFQCMIESEAEINIQSNYTTCPRPNYEKWITINGKLCYLISEWSDYLTYHDAQLICSKSGAKLVSIKSQIENDIIVNMTRKYYSKAFPTLNFVLTVNSWIGFNSLEKRGYYKWTDGTPVNFKNFAINTPKGIPTVSTQDITVQGRCAYLANTYINNTIHGFWYYSSCVDEHSFICEKDFTVTTVTPPPTQTPPGNCPQDWLQYADQKCVKFIEDKKLTFNQSFSECQSLGGELLSIHSREEQNYITSLLPNKAMPYIGLNREIGNSRTFFWRDESPFTYSNWALTSQRTYTNKCVTMLTNEAQPGKWVTVACNSTHTAICEKAKDTNITTSHSKTFPVCTIPGFEKLNFVQYKNSCYRLIEDQKTWNDAEGYCQSQNKSHLVSIVDPFEYSFLNYYLLQYAKADQFWLGFYAEGYSDTNVTQTFKWTDQWPNYLTNWDDKEPKNEGKTDRECVYQLKNNSNWRTGDCVSKKSFLCKTTLNKIPDMSNDKTGICPKLNTTDKSLQWIDLDQRSKHCYWFSSDMKFNYGLTSWLNAAFHCKLRNATLASFHSYHELSLMKSKILSNKYNTWIGLHESVYGEYVWEDSSAVDFTNWDEIPVPIDPDYYNYGEPTVSTYGDKCVELKTHDLKWIASRCSSSVVNKYFVCKTPKIYQTNTINTTNQTTLSDDILNAGLSTGAKAGIIIGVLLFICIIIGFGIFIVKKLNLSVPEFPSFENSLYASRRAANPRPNGSAVTSETSVSVTRNGKENISKIEMH